MEDYSITGKGEQRPIPPDDPTRKLSMLSPEDRQARHISVVGDTYTILVSGKETQGRYCLIDMLVPPGGGPPPHRHDFEEMFCLLEGELEFTFRGKTQMVKVPATVNIPANAPHHFKNASGKTVHMLCMCAPAGLEEFFMAVGVPLESRGVLPPKLSKEEQGAKAKLAEELAPEYRTGDTGSGVSGGRGETKHETQDADRGWAGAGCCERSTACSGGRGAAKDRRVDGYVGRGEGCQWSGVCGGGAAGDPGCGRNGAGDAGRADFRRPSDEAAAGLGDRGAVV
jgi:quercetin dioxygenase-like cupin family protein